MPDPLEKVAAALGGEGLGERFLLMRQGHPLLALPKNSMAALRALNLYQPQRGLAKRAAALLRFATRLGTHHLLLPKQSVNTNTVTHHELLPESVDRDTIGILFGSADHKVFRAVMSYRNGDQWEVGKLAMGIEGTAMLDREAETMRALSPRIPEAPELLELEATGNSRLLRMPYFQGRSLRPGDTEPVRMLLESWLDITAPALPLHSFPEWNAIHAALSATPGGEKVMESIADYPLRPSIRHGDLARWNLLRTHDGQLKVIDWEWGASQAMPGIDLVHYIAQDFRLVQKLPPKQAIDATLNALSAPTWTNYLNQSGWAGHPWQMLITSLAYKQGAAHQDNREIITAAIAARV